MTRAPVLSLENIVARYAGNTAVEIDALNVNEGELVGVVGANGAGKSTLVNAAMGWSRGKPVVTGTVRLDGEDITSLPAHGHVAKGMLLIPEGKLIFTSLSVDENLQSVARNPGPGRRAYTREEVFELFPRLKERRNHLGSQLSGGERQMLGIGRALRLAPRVLLLDEPSIGLAPQLVTRVLGTVRELAENGLSVLLVEQNVKAAIRVVHRLALIERGKLVVEGTADEMRDDPRIAEAYLGATHG